MIALYHIAKHGRSIPGLETFADVSLLPDVPVAVAAVVGSDLDPVTGVGHKDGIRTYTLWGEIAYQLDAYEVMRENDRQRIAPSTTTIAEMIGQTPTLIIIDEIANYLVRLVPRGSNEADQLTAFLFSLLELAASIPNLCLVYTLSASHDAFSDLTDELRSQFEQKQRDLTSVSARQERILTATLDDEVAGIVASRLFSSIDRTAGIEVATAFAELYRRGLDGGEPLPSFVAGSDHRQVLERSYPFHPDTLNVLINKVGTLANFQRTRGALRLLALVIRDLWQNRPNSAYLIHLHHINLGNDEIAAELTSRLDRPNMRGPIQADIVASQGHMAHAQELDASLIGAGKLPLHRYTATSVFLHSLVVGTQHGALPNEITSATSGPEIQPSMVIAALSALEEVAWHLDRTATGHYRFHTEPSLNKVVADRKQDITASAAKQEIRQRLREVYQGQLFTPIFSPSTPGEIDDVMDSVALAVIDFDSTTFTVQNTPIPSLVKTLSERAGAEGTFRQYVNRVLFLVADSGQVDRLIDRTREMLAVEQATTDVELLNSLESTQQKRLNDRKATSKLEFRVALCNAYRHLFYPSEEGLRHVALQPQDNSSAARNQQQILLDILRGLNQVLDDAMQISPIWVRTKVWPAAQKSLSVKAMYEQFFRKAGLPILRTPTILIDCIIAGLRDDAWRGKEGDAIVSKRRGNVPSSVNLAGELVLYDPQELDDASPAAPPSAPKPLKEQKSYQENLLLINPSPNVATPISSVVGSGDVNLAFSKLLDECEAAKITLIKRLSIDVQGMDSVRALGLALPGFPRRGVTVQQRLEAYAGDNDRLTLEYSLPLERTSALRSALRAFEGEVESAEMTVQIIYDPPVAPTDQAIMSVKNTLSAHSIWIKLQAERA
ncbi:MAG TPA: DUF499 domain-containing protein [Ktedonobacteraceae bacterium]|nr:DUF499 domain-containing protein [Ktedonobacteraceae bacterium]